MNFKTTLKTQPFPSNWRRGLLAALLLSSSTAWAQDDCMAVTLQEVGGRLQLQSDFGSTTPARSEKEISKDFRQIYGILETGKDLDDKFDARLTKLSQELFGSLRPAMRAASCIVFHIQPRFMHFTLDLLPIDDEPLFVQKPVAYSFKPPAAPDRLAESDFSAKPRGLILRDPETDPQNAAGHVQKLYPTSQFQLIKNTTPAVFEQANYDFLVISSHGSVRPVLGAGDPHMDDSIRLGKEELNADELDTARFGLVYYDSCQLGLSKPFIDAASKGGARYYLAPIISNESGNSSTWTMKYFFNDVHDGKTPMDAMFHARQKIYQDVEGKATPTERIFFAYPFRLYLL